MVAGGGSCCGMGSRDGSKFSGRRRCRYCWKLYRPDPRLGDRQKTCGGERCRRAQHQEADRRWHAEHPEYDTARRLRELEQRLEVAGEPAAVVRQEAEPGCRVPTDEVRDVFGARGLVVLLIFVRLLGRHAQDAIQERSSRDHEGIGRVTPGRPARRDTWMK